MYVNVRLTAGTLEQRLPRAAARGAARRPGSVVLVVGADGMVAQKRVETVAVVDNDWVISSGLDDGDQVVVSGLQKAQPGTPVKAAVPARGAEPPAHPRSRACRSTPAARPPPVASVRHGRISSSTARSSPGSSPSSSRWVACSPIRALPADAYPDIAPPQVSISATYPGADAETIERTVTQVIEQQLTGIDNADVFHVVVSSNGAGSITLMFETGTDPDVAAVQTQNRVALADAAPAARSGAAGPARSPR